MGCFDFTYADNGSNIRQGSGYIYLTNNFSERTGLKGPVRFRNTNSYGDFNILIPRYNSIFTVDIYAIYAAMIYLENECKDTAESYIKRYIYLCYQHMLMIMAAF